MLEKVKSLIEEPLSKENIEVVSVSYEDIDGAMNLVIVIDTKPYVDLNTCVKATHIINPILDEADLISESYILNVCSKGEDE